MTCSVIDSFNTDDGTLDGRDASGGGTWGKHPDTTDRENDYDVASGIASMEHSPTSGTTSHYLSHGWQAGNDRHRYKFRMEIDSSGPSGVNFSLLGNSDITDFLSPYVEFAISASGITMNNSEDAPAKTVWSDSITEDEYHDYEITICAASTVWDVDVSVDGGTVQSTTTNSYIQGTFPQEYIDPYGLSIGQGGNWDYIEYCYGDC